MSAPLLRLPGSNNPRQRGIVIALAVLAGIALIWFGSRGSSRSPVAPALPSAPPALASTQSTATAEAPAESASAPASEPLPQSTDRGLPLMGPKQGPGSFDTAGMLLQTVGYLLVLLVMAALVIFLLRRFAPKLRIGGPRQIVVKETTYLGPRKSLHLVEVAGRKLFLGSTRDRIDLLADVTGKEFRLPEEPADKGTEA